MRTPPATSLELAGSRRWRFLFCSIAAASLSAGAAALCSHLELGGWAAGLWVAAAGLAGALAGAPLARGPCGHLRWDGAQWWWRGRAAVAREHAGQLHVMMDFGRWMLLRFDPENAAQRRLWLPVAAASSMQDHALRAAVYCRRLSPSNLRVVDADPDERR